MTQMRTWTDRYNRLAAQGPPYVGMDFVFAQQFGLIPAKPVAPEMPLTEFHSSVVRPDGMVLTVSIQVDVEKYGPDYLELTEVTQMALARMAHDLNRNEAVKVDLAEDMMRRRVDPLDDPRPRADHPVPGGLDG